MYFLIGAVIVCILVAVYWVSQSREYMTKTQSLRGIYAARSPSYISYLILPNEPNGDQIECYLLTNDINADDGAPVSASFHILTKKSGVSGVWTWDGRDTLTIADNQITLAKTVYKQLPAGAVAGVWRGKSTDPYYVVVPDEPTSKGFVWYEVNGHYLTDKPGAVTLAFKHSAEKDAVGWSFNWSKGNKKVGAIGDRVMNIGSRDQPGQLVKLQKTD